MPRLPVDAPADDPIRSRTNPLVQRLRTLKEKGIRGGEGLMLLEGGRLVAEAMAAGLELVEVAASARFGQNAPESRVVEELAVRGVPLRRMDSGLLASLSELETSPGVLAIARRPVF